MLDKIFPQKGSKVPEIRFKGFTDLWQEQSFEKFFDCTIPTNTFPRAELSYSEGTVFNVHYGDVLIKYGSILDVKNNQIPRILQKNRNDFVGALLQDGDIIFADTAEDESAGKACEIINSQGNAIVSGLHTIVCRPHNQMALGFLGYYLNSPSYHHQLIPLMQGIKVLSLTKSSLQKTIVCHPTSLDEQSLIGQYFSHLDRLISLNRQKLEKLQSLKKAMLEQMFPAPPRQA